MLSNTQAIPTIPTKDMATARKFYEGVLGLPAGQEQMDGIIYTTGSSTFLLYESPYAGTNKATAMSFEVEAGDFDRDVEDLRKKGVTFQTFEMPDEIPGEWRDGVGVMGEMKSVWFADPDGNILNVETGLKH